MQKWPLFEKFIDKYTIKRLKYGILGCFRGVEGAAKNWYLENFPDPPLNLTPDNLVNVVAAKFF